MPSRTIALPNPTGLHARPAAVFSKAAADSGADVTVSKDDQTANAKSLLSLLTLDCHKGDIVTISVEGDDADRVLDELVALVESGLGEPLEAGGGEGGQGSAAS
jgi:phosphotransferase system HPr (HPr) family protein